jgi:putative tryptophan/tyrosine transport system substrate-binding protein
MRRIGVLMPLTMDDPDAQPRVTAFKRGLQELGWMNGRNVRIEYRWAAGDASRMRTYAAELVGLTPDVILANSSPILAALRQETRTVPIVFVIVIDPIGGGFVSNLAHPGGNITGFTNFEFSMGGKWLEMLKDAAPVVARVAVIFNPETAFYAVHFLRSVEAAASSLAVKPIATPIHDAAEIERAIDAFARESNGGLLVLPDTSTTVHRELIVALAGRHRLPAVFPFRFFATSGGLLSYGIDASDVFRQAASYIDRILRGANPGELPVQAPTKFELVINLKTAAALGLTISRDFLLRADEVIE